MNSQSAPSFPASPGGWHEKDGFVAVACSVQTSPGGQAVPRHSGPNEKVTHMNPSGHDEQPVL